MTRPHHLRHHHLRHHRCHRRHTGATMAALAGVLAGVFALATPASSGRPDEPHSTCELDEYYVTIDGKPVDGSGEGCPETGGGPTDTPPGVFVEFKRDNGHFPPFPPGFTNVVDGKIVYEAGDPSYYFPLSSGTAWSGTLDPDTKGGSSGPHVLWGVCTTLLEIAEDGISLDPDSIERATFVSATFMLGGVAHDSSSTTTTTTTTTTTSTPPTTPLPQPPPATPVRTAPTLTG